LISINADVFFPRIHAEGATRWEKHHL